MFNKNKTTDGIAFLTGSLTINNNVTAAANIVILNINAPIKANKLIHTPKNIDKDPISSIDPVNLLK